MMAKVEASKFVATMPGVAAYAAWLGCLPSRLMVVVPSVTYRGARHGCFCPSYVFADEACFLDVSLESFAYKDEMKSDCSLIPLVLAVQFHFGVLRRSTICGSWYLRR